MDTWASCRFLYVLVVGLACGTLPGVATGAGGPLPALPRFSVADGGRLPPPWRVIGLPKNKVALTQFGIVDLEGERVLRVASDRSYGNLTHELADLNLEAQATLRWKWRLPRFRRERCRFRPHKPPLTVCAKRRPWAQGPRWMC